MQIRSTNRYRLQTTQVSVRTDFVGATAVGHIGAASQAQPSNLVKSPADESGRK